MNALRHADESRNFAENEVEERSLIAAGYDPPWSPAYKHTIASTLDAGQHQTKANAKC